MPDDPTTDIQAPGTKIAEEQAPNNGHRPAAQSDQVELNSNMSLAEAGCAVLAFHFDHLVANEEGTRHGDNPEALHDMRVATNRIRAALRDFEEAFAQPILKPLSDDAHWLADLLGKIRDLDVFVQWLEKYESSVEQDQQTFVRQVIGDRQAARSQERAALLDGLNSQRYMDFKRTFSDFLRAPADEIDRETHETLDTLAANKIEKELGRVRKKAKGANDKHLTRLHQLRIECKRLRYTTEFFSSVFPRLPKNLINRLTDIQSELGDVHDTDVQMQFLKDMRHNSKDDDAKHSVLTGMIDKLKNEQRKSYKAFRKDYRKFSANKYQRKIAKHLQRA